jgi:hypothetical protein
VLSNNKGEMTFSELTSGLQKSLSKGAKFPINPALNTAVHNTLIAKGMLKFTKVAAVIKSIALIAVIAGLLEAALSNEVKAQVTKISEHPELAFTMDPDNVKHKEVFNAIEKLEDTALKDYLINNFNEVHELSQYIAKENDAAVKEAIVNTINKAAKDNSNTREELNGKYSSKLINAK